MSLLMNLKACSLATLLVAAGACGTESDNKGNDGGNDAGGDIDAATLTWLTKPPTKITLGDSFTASWTVETKGTLHITELRACKGNKPDCGSGDLTTFDETGYSTEKGDHYESTLELPTTGEWTIIAYCHVGEKPHRSEPTSTTVE